LKPPRKLEEIVAPVSEELRQVEHLLRDGTRSVASLINEAGHYTFAGGGKRIRPALVLLASRLCGYRGPRAIQLATAVELLHAATLVHDDVVDDSPVRRGRPSVNAKFGTKLAILVGDFLYAQSSQMVVEDGNPDLLAMLADAILRMAEGEVLQLSRSFDPALPESLYLDVIGRKTATLMAAATESGAIIAGVTRSERRAVREYGWQLGLAFQLADDVLDYVGSGEELGKLTLTDLREGKVTLPLLLTLKRCTVAEGEEISAAIKDLALASVDDEGEPDPDQLQRVLALVERYRGVELTLARARECIELALFNVEPFEECEAKQALRELAEFVVVRRF
jgi:octaprenyl-diphosphate synthase